MQHHDDIQQLVSRFMMAETTIEEERRLTEYFRSATDIPAEWRTVAAMLLGAAAKPSMKVQRRSRKPLHTLQVLSWRYVAAAVVLLALPLGWLWHQSVVRQPDVQDFAMQQSRVKAQPSQSAHTGQNAESASKATSTSSLTHKAVPSRKTEVVHVADLPVRKPDAVVKDERTEPQQKTQDVSEEAMKLVVQRLQEELQYQKLVEDLLQNMAEQRISQTTYSI